MRALYEYIHSEFKLFYISLFKFGVYILDCAFALNVCRLWVWMGCGCAHECVHVCGWVCMCTCKYACVWIVGVGGCACVHPCRWVWMRVCIYACMWVDVYVCS